jgi:beta-galactosidase
MQLWLYGIGLALGITVTSTLGWAADFGDTTGPGGTRMPCTGEDRVTTDTALNPTEPVVSTSPRQSITINRDWTFFYSPKPERDDQPALPRFDDSRWPAISLPHTWSTYETTRELHPFIKSASEREDPYWWYGWGWYRKRFVVNRRAHGKKIFVEFDGVQKYSRVYLNGTFVGEHKGGYTSFSFDLTNHVRFGKTNVLAVQVSGRRDDLFGGIPPMTAGNFDVYGGIYRDVRLVITDRLYIPFQGSANQQGGTFITTPELSASQGVVQVRTWIRNDYPAAKDCLVVTSIVDASGRLVTKMESRQTIGPGQLAEVVQRSAAIPNPHLWSPDSPYLYREETVVKDGDREADTWRSPLGFRWFSWSKTEKTLYVNGKKIHIHGTNRHQEYPWLGDAIPKWIHEWDLNVIRRELGHNFLRTAHYPQDPLVYDLTDRLGIIVVEEVPNIKNLEFGDDIQEQNVREMIRRDRNHPSIFFWSMGNETNDAADSNWAWQEDQTRIIHLRKGKGGGSYVTHTHADLDMENLLRCTIRGWYDRDDVLSAREDHTGEPKEGQIASTEEWQHQMALVEGGSVRGRIDGNIVAWLYADHGADRVYKYVPLKYVNPKGWVDAYRIPKYMYYLWQANYSEKPMMFVHPHFWRQQYLGQKKDIVVDSNCDTVELKVNGKSLGIEHPGAPFHTVAYHTVTVIDALLEAEARKGSTVIRAALPMAGPPARLVLTTSHDRITADRAGIALITADIVDERGQHVYGARNSLTWSVSGPGVLVGPDRYESDAAKDRAATGTMYIDTPVSNVIRSTTTPGTIRMSVSSPGLRSAEIAIISQKLRPQGASFVVEPPLRDEGRSTLRRDPAYRVQ